MVTDPIADFLTRIRNAQMANHRMVEIPASNLKKRITEILYHQGYILKSLTVISQGTKTVNDISKEEAEVDPESVEARYSSLNTATATTGCWTTAMATSSRTRSATE